MIIKQKESFNELSKWIIIFKGRYSDESWNFVRKIYWNTQYAIETEYFKNIEEKIRNKHIVKKSLEYKCKKHYKYKGITYYRKIITFETREFTDNRIIDINGSITRPRNH